MFARFALATTASLALASLPASAATVIYGAGNPGGMVTLASAGPGAVSSGISFDVSGTGAFTAVFSFDNPFNPAAAGGSASFNYDPDRITFTGASFTGGLGTVAVTAGAMGSSIQINLPNLAQGAKTLTFSGKLNRPAGGNAFARIGGQLTLTAAVPEPATWALFILGFGAVGAALRRRGEAVRVGKARLVIA